MAENKPHEIRIGRIKATVWKNETEKGPRYNVQFSRLYKENDGDDWQESDNFGRDELLVLAKVADQAHTWIYEQKQNQ